MLLNLTDWAFSFIFPCFQGWTVKSKTTFNKMSPVTVLGHSYLLNSEGKPFTLHCPLNSFIWKSFSFKCKTHSLPLRWGREVSPGLRVSGLADLQEGVSSAGGFHVDHRLWLGLHAAQWADAASTRTRGSSDAQRFVSALIAHVKWQLTDHFPVESRDTSENQDLSDLLILSDLLNKTA